MIIAHDRLRDLAAASSQPAAVRPTRRQIVADHLIEAHRRGHDSHGVGMLVAYVRDFEAGTLKPN